MTDFKRSRSHPYTLGAAQAHHQNYVNRPITLPSLDWKKQFDVETFREDCPRCRKLEKPCDLCGAA